ncbi:hypothetical protein ATANTOWER_010226 [Ataeniobius toweri]|uniref:Calcitonin peptide-like domain-containing protein n=1 Tax=Ataeniobius toweri TaxID=208326 RepID=A0ABU7BT19_9TELE|nr:hypothetical protein [Ataeniobius toweri]
MTGSHRLEGSMVMLGLLLHHQRPPGFSTQSAPEGGHLLSRLRALLEPTGEQNTSRPRNTSNICEAVKDCTTAKTMKTWQNTMYG